MSDANANDLKRTRRQKGPVPTEQLPPYSAETELSVIASVLFAPERAAECLNTLEERGVTAAWFYRMELARAFQAMRDMHQAGEAVDTITLAAHLKKTGALADVGGLPALAEWAGAFGIPSNLSAYLDELEEQWQRRKALQVAATMTLEAYAAGTDPHRFIEEATREILKLGEAHAGAAEQRIKELVLRAINRLEDYHRGRAQMRGLSTGLEYLDKLLCGIGEENGNYFVLSGRPGTGKTSLATQIVEHVGMDHVWWDPILEMKDGALRPVLEIIDGKERFKCERKVGLPVCVFSLEMAALPLVERMLFQRAGADMQRWRTGFAESDGLRRLTIAASQLAKPSIFVDDTSRCTVESLRSRARRLHRQHGIKLFVIDYVQLIRAERRSNRVDRQQELSDISAEIQALGKELNVPFLVLAQMNRDFEKDPKRQPRLADLKDCGAIEQDADVVSFLYYPKLDENEEEKYDAAMLQAFGKDWGKYPKRVNLLVAKNRYGPADKLVKFLFEGSSTHYLDYVAWMKAKGYADPAQGEHSLYKDRELPTNEDMDL